MKVKFLPFQPHCFAFGGFETQTLATFEAIKSKNYDVEKMNVWDRSTDFDILHCWGMGVGNYENFYWAKKSEKLLVATILLYYFESFLSKIKFHISSYVHLQKFHIKLLSFPDAIVVVNDKQANVCNLLYKVPAKKIHIIPHVVNDKFFSNVSSDVSGGYFLTVGNVCKRKNQALLAEACIEAGVKLVIIGKPLDGEADYAHKLDNIVKANSNITWIKGLKENSDELINYYLNCYAYALPSLIEQQPISALEAAIIKKPLLIANRDYAKQSYFTNSCLVNPLSKHSILQGLKQIIDTPDLYVPDYKNLLACKSENVGSAYIDIYKRIN